ncbi:unnamed protein product [Closterium sp. NIES-64]|nr:unnamed protein product [Closterium sp. NIES-64]
MYNASCLRELGSSSSTCVPQTPHSFDLVPALLSPPLPTPPSPTLTTSPHFTSAASSDGTLRLWELASGNCVRVCQGHPILSPSSPPLFRPHSSALAPLPPSPRLCPVHLCSVIGRHVAASSDGKSRQWKLASGNHVRVYQGHQKAVVCCALNDGTNLPPA